MATPDEIWPEKEPAGVFGAFQESQFQALIQQRGTTLRWSRAIQCPCSLAPDRDDQFDPNCPRCAGDGYFYINPRHYQRRGVTDAYIDVMGVLSTVKLDPTVKDVVGGWDFGDALLTVQSPMRVGYFDRFVGLDHEMAHSEYLVRDPSHTTPKPPTEMVIPIGKLGRPKTEKAYAMSYEPIEVNYLAWDIDGVLYVAYPNEDFIMIPAAGTEPQKVAWKSYDKGPPPGQRYVVHYTCRPVWIVDDATYAVQSSQARKTLKGTPGEKKQLPTTFKVRLDWLTRKRGT